MSSPEKKKRKRTTKKPSPILIHSPELTPIPSLPDDLLVSCLSRVSRLYYPTLSLVSKTFRSLLASPELYETRSSLNRTESCLYVCLRVNSKPSWFTLCKKPDQIKTLNNDISKKKKKKSCGYVLAPVMIPQATWIPNWNAVVGIGSNIYYIGGPVEEMGSCSSSVSILDCRSNTWREAPRMQLERYFAAANVVDGKIYVAGGCKDCDSSNWMEVFDPETQVWEVVSSPGKEICGCEHVGINAGIDGKVYIFGSRYNGLAYTVKEGKWERVGEEMDKDWVRFSYCVIGGVLYYYWEKEFKWYDVNARVWRVLKGVKGLPKFSRYIARLADYGGKMAVLWEKVLASREYKEKMILCAVIALERRNEEEIWGKVEWHDDVLTVTKSHRLEYAIAATV